MHRSPSRSSRAKKGLSHLDAEFVIPPSSYKRTTEGKIVAKKSRNKKKAVGKTDGFQRVKEKILEFHRILIKFFLRDFCLALNETVPYSPRPSTGEL